MLERDGYPAGVPCWIDTGRVDPQAAARFYGDLFGWEFEDRMPPESPDQYLVAQLKGRDVAGIGSQTDSASAPVWNTYIWVESADEAAGRAREPAETWSTPRSTSARPGAWRCSPTRRGPCSASGRRSGTGVPSW